ncbi:MAG: LysM peptidoglycan-binding domain-containing protein [Verrucomicrobia bacterium]|nr:LysM peptidoglycan-binding domain-containing protein [Verrucomicrobiota bacterium]
MKQESKQPKNAGIAGRLNMAGWRKHYVAAMTADEETWPQREPGSNLGRVFIILLLLHVFLIGAVVFYNVISPKSPPAVATAKPTLAKPEATTLKTAASTSVPKALAINPSSDNLPAVMTPVLAPPNPEARLVETAIYDVRSGDNVPGIAAALGVSAADLIRLNNLDNTELYPGRKLTYPKKMALPVLKAMPIPSNSTNTATSRPGTIKTVSATSANTAPVKLKENPAVTSSDSPPKTITAKTTVQAGDQPPATIAMHKETPSGSSAKPKTTPVTDSSKPAKTTAKIEKPVKDAASRRSHIVGPKETLYSIARKYGVKVDALQKANSIKDPTALRDGMKLVIPSKN